MLIDKYNRQIRKLRVSLTDQCNLRCHYCMPLDAQFMEKKNYLQVDEYYEIIKELIDFGLEEIRLTGGEPLLRQNFAEIIQKLSTLNLKKIGLTTNGIILDRYLELLLDCGIVNVNISLDSLNPITFKQITYGNYLTKIKENISLAKKQGFAIKINTVMMKGINDHEVFDFIEYAKELKIEVRFLELMRIGYACGQQKDQFISAETLLNKIKEKYQLIPINSALDSTSFNFITNCGAKIGFIASESQPFCGNCSRWRLSVDGILRACLLKDEGLSIRNLKADQRLEIYQQLLGMKPYLRPPEVTHLMYKIGG